MTIKSRPLSPHLQVYRWQITMFLSIVHRATGTALAAGAVLAAWWLMAILVGGACFDLFITFSQSIVGKIMFFGWLWALTFHFLNGIRHLVWDTARGLEIRSAALSGWLTLGASVLFSALIWLSAGA
jgi:succinate dehydrogenase / fumarate reductase cytochrome b subunit